ncbi:unnamed protein product [Ilex paraguariensis]|uniref:Uncharacterized protein n=1 Tax=Ilex paraguariensis TaxID=185542 RepID=A0ABC8S0U1_9AQUA
MVRSFEVTLPLAKVPTSIVTEAPASFAPELPEATSDALASSTPEVPKLPEATSDPAVGT